MVCILLGCIFVRLYKIDNPIADWHSFRQADTASVTRIYSEDGLNLFYPRYHDISTTQSGIFNPYGWRFVEFPIFNALHLVLYRILPFFDLEITGRLISIFSAVFSTCFIFLIMRRLVNRNTALIASFLYALLPFNIYFTRVILPEPLAVTFALASIWFFILYLDRNSYVSYFLSVIAFSSALLIKPYLFFYGFPILYILLSRYSVKKIIKMKSLYFWVFMAVAPFFFWRTWMSHFPEGIPFWTWTFNGDGIRFQPSFWRWIFGERLTSLILGYWGLIPFAFGLLASHKRNRLVLAFLFGAFVYISIFATANVRHDYYQTIVIPPITMVLAFGIEELWKLKNYSKVLIRGLLFFSLGVMFVASAIQVKEFYKINRPEIIQAGIRANEILPKGDLVIAPYNGDTAFLYQTKRRGWPVVDRPIDELIQKGAHYFISVDLNHYQTVEFSNRFRVVESTPTFVIIDLTQQK